MAVLGEAQFTPISSATGDGTLVAAQGVGIKIRVLAFFLVAAAAATAKFQSGTGGTDLTGNMTMATGVSLEGGGDGFGLFETAANALLNLRQGGTVQLSGYLIWCQAQ